MRKTIIISFLIFSLGHVSFCQTRSAKTDILKARKQSASDAYSNVNVTNILTGRTYDLKYLLAINSQFFQDSYPVNGSLVYDGVLFPNISLQYDLYAQKVVVLLESIKRTTYISIDTDKISRFSINESDFVNVSGDSVMENGIYELSYNGEKSTLYTKRVKNKIESIENKKDLVWTFVPENRYFIKNKYGTFQIDSKKSLLNSFYNSEQLRSILKAHRIKTSKRRFEQGIISALQYMDKPLNVSE